MRILYVSQYFPPEMGAPAARVSELSRAWVNLGHQVTVLTAFPHHPTGIKAPSDQWTLMRRETYEGVDVVRTYVYAAANTGTLRRMASYASFLASATTLGFSRVDPPDVVIGTSPQLLCGLAGFLLARTLHSPFVFEVRDLWPESITAVQALQENIVIRGLRRLSRKLYRDSEHIVTVGEGYKQNIVSGYGIDPEKISVVPNGADPAFFAPSPAREQIRAQRGWTGRCVVLYAGTLGMAHGLQHALEAARLLSAERFRFVFVGEGAEKERLKRQAAELRLSNIEFINQQPKDVLVELYSAADIGLVSLRKSPVFEFVLPSKMFEYLAVERAVALCGEGEDRKLIETAQAGLAAEPENPPALAAVLTRLADDDGLRAEMGRRGRAFVRAHFDRQCLAGKYIEVLQNVIAASQR